MWKHKRVPIRVDILSVFVTLFVITIAFIITITSIQSSQSMLFVSEKLMSVVSSKITPALTSHLNPAKSASQFAARLIKAGALDTSNTQQLEKYTYNLLKTLPQVAMAYWGDAKGNFVIARRQADNTVFTEIINRNVSPATRTYHYYDANDKRVRTTTSPKLDYDPRMRPWFLQAKQARKTVWSDAYLFYSGVQRTLGITSASPVYDQQHQLQGVFGVDVKLGAISRFLSRERIGEHGVVFVVTKEGRLIAYPGLEKLIAAKDKHSARLININSLSKPGVAKSFTEFKLKKQAKFTFKGKGEAYLAAYQLIPEFKVKNWYVGVVVPEDDFIGGLKKSGYISLAVSLLILLIGIISISALSKKISQPIVRLAREVENIKLFQLTAGPRLTSHIREIDMMSAAVDSMKYGLRSFQRYVPKSLVKKLLLHEEEAQVGGQEKEITVFFSDIANFTSISEILSPDQLVAHLGGYFEELTSIIIAHEGTLDKYIGDSMMAFWGAPIDDHKHCYHACLSALLMQKTLSGLNKQWVQENKIALPTRMGLDTGIALVGNMGSSERINYTAMGDTINIASRLEHLNRFYGTKILVSETVANKVSDQFYFRIIDNVIVKGRSRNIAIYELVATKNIEKINEKYQTYCEEFANAMQSYQAQNWRDAIIKFEKFLSSYPENKAAMLFIERCEYFLKNPPGNDWDGAWQFETKG